MSFSPDKELLGQLCCLSTTLVVSLFKKEEEEVGIASDVVKVVGEERPP